MELLLTRGCNAYELEPYEPLLCVEFVHGVLNECPQSIRVRLRRASDPRDADWLLLVDPTGDATAISTRAQSGRRMRAMYPDAVGRVFEHFNMERVSGRWYGFIVEVDAVC